MRKILALLFVMMLGFIIFNRHRIYIRDPLASVYRNDVRQDGVAVYIDYEEDVLVWKQDDPGAYQVLVQHWNLSPGTPKQLGCLQSMVCLAEAAHVPTNPLFVAANGLKSPPVTMAGHTTTFTMPDSSVVRVETR
jgi:hypothetical protein